MKTSNKKEIKGIKYGVYCGHRYYPTDWSGPVPVPNPKDTQSMERIIKKQQEEERVRYE